MIGKGFSVFLLIALQSVGHPLLRRACNAAMANHLDAAIAEFGPIGQK